MRYFKVVRAVALVGTAVALTGGTLLAQDATRERQELREHRARERALWGLSMEPGQVVVASGRQARLGVYPDTDQDEEIDAQGARIRGVVEGGPADEAGLEEGDIIVELNGRSLLQPLPDPEDEDDLDPDESLPIQRLVATARKLDRGDEVRVVYLRDGERRTTTLTADVLDGFRVGLSQVDPGRIEVRLRELRELPGFGDDEDSPGVFRFFRRGADPEVYHLRNGLMGRCPGEEGGWSVLMNGCVAGVRLVPLNRRLGEYFESDEGVLVADVVEDSSLGLLPGDVILSIGGRSVEEPRDVNRILGSYREGEEVEFQVVRRGRHQEVRGTIAE